MAKTSRGAAHWPSPCSPPGSYPSIRAEDLGRKILRALNWGNTTNRSVAVAWGCDASLPFGILPPAGAAWSSCSARRCHQTYGLQQSPARFCECCILPAPRTCIEHPCGSPWVLSPPLFPPPCPSSCSVWVIFGHFGVCWADPFWLPRPAGRAGSRCQPFVCFPAVGLRRAGITSHSSSFATRAFTTCA